MGEKNLKYINELVEGEKVESVFAATEKQLRTTRAGKPFLSMRLSDKTGSVEAVAWDNAEALSLKFEKGDIIGVRAEVSTYQGSLQLGVTNLKKVEDTGEYIGRFVPSTEKDVEAMVEELRGIVATVESQGVRDLLDGLLGDERFIAGFKSAPAAKGMHHAFSGGLLQHTLKVVRLCDLIYKEYSQTDPVISAMLSRDLLIAGALLHDIGKVEELSQGPGFDYTFKGRLLGHVSLGLMELKGRLDRTEGIPEETADLLMHMLISHHGEYEFGSPKRPKCMEAFILHYADNLDAKLEGLFEFAEKDTSEGRFTGYHRLYERYFYKPGT
jgi:3'-5' exoribonuclease